MLTATDTTARSLAEIARTDPQIRAWVHVAAEAAMSQATAIDRRSQETSLPLVGMTVGIKDIIDVAGMPTGAGFEPFANRIATTDATVVTRLRRAGVTIIGKTTTTQFASGDPTRGTSIVRQPGRAPVQRQPSQPVTLIWHSARRRPDQPCDRPPSAASSASSHLSAGHRETG
jgi:Asp-tRNA(Asn)/Glu-tRNA(Gln) amidotransferase A subunit family amidase